MASMASKGFKGRCGQKKKKFSANFFLRPCINMAQDQTNVEATYSTIYVAPPISAKSIHFLLWVWPRVMQKWGLHWWSSSLAMYVCSLAMSVEERDSYYSH